MVTIFHSLWAPVSRFLDRTGMYRVVTIGLTLLALIALVAGIGGLLPYTAFEQLLSLGSALVTALAVNALAARLLHISVNHESAVITGLIVHFLVVPPPLASVGDYALGAGVAALAVCTKFIIVWRKQHIINPAAGGAIMMAFLFALLPASFGTFETGWWIGTPLLFIPLALIGCLVVTKVRKWAPVLAFLGAGYAMMLFEEWRLSGDLMLSTQFFWLSGPSLFLAIFMLTEPFTMPPRRTQQIGYGVLVGLLSQTYLLAPVVKMTPELALVVGNLAFYYTTLRQKLALVFSSRRELALGTYEFVFKKPARFSFLAGQYLEWMLPHAPADSRGLRRYFTIASSSTEPDVRLALKVVERGSTYKQALLSLRPGDSLIGSQLAGDFVLPESATEKLGFIAGGIGVTPFRSHLAYMADAQIVHDTILFYCNNTSAEIAYRDECTHFAKVLPLRLVHVLAKEKHIGSEFEEGFVTKEMIARRAPDYGDRTWYLSGPPGMVNAYSTLLKEMGVTKIVEDFFPGLA
ncbi:RnfABCDGE type electron transport complex subunit D [Patescibacteria group bacterium]|nr:RnfABCDGE type electron transport complex subunit D [Patescibacteria group bacterium]